MELNKLMTQGGAEGAAQESRGKTTFTMPRVTKDKSTDKENVRNIGRPVSENVDFSVFSTLPQKRNSSLVHLQIFK